MKNNITLMHIEIDLHYYDQSTAALLSPLLPPQMR